ncbi:alpha/beta fold hydrolase [Arthrobacter crystallopoietes]|uniref:alpha/beta fold hydrolase n=1 Tax=Crystallibacter crystallopoietes TaxID=37928 RepID=UPI003D1CDD0D
MELPGFGEARSPQEQVAIAQFAALVREALSRIGVESAVLIGHSMGAQIVAEIAAREPPHLVWIVLSDYFRSGPRWHSRTLAGTAAAPS